MGFQSRYSLAILSPVRHFLAMGRPTPPLDNIPIHLEILPVKTTIDLPEEILHRAKIVAAQRKTTLKDLVIVEKVRGL